MIEKRQFYINGQWVKPSQINDLEVIDPSTEEVCAIISLGSEKDTDDAVKSAKNSFESWWGTSKEKKLELPFGRTRVSLYEAIISYPIETTRKYMSKMLSILSTIPIESAKCDDVKTNAKLKTCRYYLK